MEKGFMRQLGFWAARGVHGPRLWTDSMNRCCHFWACTRCLVRSADEETRETRVLMRYNIPGFP
jgi:hypothetical protein